MPPGSKEIDFQGVMDFIRATLPGWGVSLGVHHVSSRPKAWSLLGREVLFY